MKTITIDLYLLEPPCQGRFFLFWILYTVFFFSIKMYIVGISYIIHNIHVQMNLFYGEKDFFRTNNIPFMEKKEEKISLIYHRIIPLAIPEI